MAKPTDRQCLRCKVPVMPGKVACFTCWYRLPLAVRELRGLEMGRAAAEWFRDNPEEGK